MERTRGTISYAILGFVHAVNSISIVICEMSMVGTNLAGGKCKKSYCQS